MVLLLMSSLHTKLLLDNVGSYVMWKLNSAIWFSTTQFSVVGAIARLVLFPEANCVPNWIFSLTYG